MSHATTMLQLSLCVLALSACKKQEPTDKPAAAAKAAPADEAARPADPAVASVDFKKFATDRMTVQDLAAVYPAGKPFTMTGKLGTAPACTESSCKFDLTDGGKTSISFFEVTPDSKAKLEGKAPGAEVVLRCTPVYNASGVMEFEKSCTAI